MTERGVPVGFVLPPDPETLGLLDEVIAEEPDYYEVTPETLWRPARPRESDDDEDARCDWSDGCVEPNDYYHRFLELGRRTGRPFVAHGVALSVGGLGDDDAARRETWRRRIAETHAAFAFLWYSDHLGATHLAGRNLTLPVPVPMLGTVADRIRGELAALQEIVPAVALENSAFYYALGDPLDEPGFLARALGGPGMHLLLDLHNLHVNAENLGFDPMEWLDRFPLERVIEIHLAGGGWSEPDWLPAAEPLRLDSHDAAVPEVVWDLFAAVVPRCSRLRGVTLERIEGSVGVDDVDVIREELRRARAVLA